MSHLFDRKTDNFFGSLSYLGYVLLLVGLATASSPWWWGEGADQTQMLAVGGLLVVLGFLFKFTYHGFQLDLQHRRVREYLSMFGFKTGKWAPLPAFQRITLTSLQAAHDYDHGHSHGEESAPLVTWYTIGLYSQSPSADYELRTDNQEDARQTLKLLAEKLGIAAEDHTLASSRES
ncbi:hypothetical protein [Rufibacter soli]